MEKTLKLQSNNEAISLYGSLDKNLRFAESEFHVRISARNHLLRIVGPKANVERAVRFFQQKLKELRGGGVSDKLPASDSPAKPSEAKTPPRAQSAEDIHFYHRGKNITSKGKNQARYLKAIRDHDIVFAIGPAGTGKTYLAVASAVEKLKKKLISRIILTRPAVEAGENLGFLPGDMQAKVNPYLRPLYDALYDMMTSEDITRYFETGVIEIAPLAYMRGRTLHEAFVILDESQNTTHAQMKMLLTRLGSSSKAVITGDITQIDLPGAKKSGLVEAKEILSKVSGIKFVYFDDTDVVRHPLVREIIKAYDKHERK